MLNRRTLRIKAMQSLFAYEQCKRANYNLGLEQIEHTFSVDLNSMLVQDKKLLKLQANEAIKLYKSEYRKKTKKVSGGSEPIINEVVNKAIKEYHSQLKKDSTFLKKEMLKDAEQIYARYSWLLFWLAAITDLIKSGKRKLGSANYLNLVNNTVVSQITNHKKLAGIYSKSKLSWDTHEDEIIVWLNEVLLKDEMFLNYLDLKDANFTDDKSIILYIYKSLVFKNSEIIGVFMDQQDLYWSENKAILRSMVLKTLKAIEQDNADFELAELSYNWQEDKQFFETIFDQTVKEEENYEGLIASKSKNWDFERISETDKVLLQMAIQEMINFPGIPLKVTINEYIEVSKKYSTPKSKQFINGILDVIAVDLQEKGEIKKSGRGLIDNK